MKLIAIGLLAAASFWSGTARAETVSEPTSAKLWEFQGNVHNFSCFAKYEKENDDYTKCSEPGIQNGDPTFLVSSGVFYLLLPAETDAYKRLHFWADKKAKIIGFKCKKGGINCIRVIKIEKAD